MANIKKLRLLGEHTPSTWKGFLEFERTAMADGVVPKKYKELIALAVSLTTQCTYCLEIHRKAAEAAGATQQEMAETAMVAAALRAGAAAIYATHILGGEKTE